MDSVKSNTFKKDRLAEWSKAWGAKKVAVIFGGSKFLIS